MWMIFLSHVMYLLMHDFIINTEKIIRQHETNAPTEICDEWTMYLDLRSYVLKVPRQKGLSLKRVQTEKDWDKLFYVRQAVEVAFGIDDGQKVKSFIQDVRVKVDQLKGVWFLCDFKGQIVGQIGIIPFEYKEQKIGRLQDVDIIPKFQSMGYGKFLLNNIVSKAIDDGYDGLCLMAKSSDWPKGWYQDFGFCKVGAI